MGLFSNNSESFNFDMFSISHIINIFLLFIVSMCLFLFKEKLKTTNLRKYEIGVAIFLILVESTYHYWMYINKNWNLSHSLPLELCSISLILSILLLLSRKKVIYEILLFTSLLGASQAIFTPLLYFDFPHFRYFHFFITHLMIIWISLYFTWVNGYRPTIFSIIKLLVFLNVLMPFIMLINKKYEGNYMFLSHKPETASLMDYLGPHPWYILSLECLLLILSLIVWLFLRDKSKDKLN